MIAEALILAGLFFFAIGALGLVRLPDFYSRTHAATKCDTLGAGLTLFGLAMMEGITASGAKILMLALFIFLTSPTAAHAIAKAAHKSGLKPWGEN